MENSVSDTLNCGVVFVKPTMCAIVLLLTFVRLVHRLLRTCVPFLPRVCADYSAGTFSCNSLGGKAQGSDAALNVSGKAT